MSAVTLTIGCAGSHAGPALPPSSGFQLDARQVVNRLTFGPRPGDVEAIEKFGVRKWIDAQLIPDRIDDSKLEGIAGVVKDVVVYVDRDGNLMAAHVDLGAKRVIGEAVRIPTGSGEVRYAAMSLTGTLVMQVVPVSYQAVLVDERGVAEPLLPDTVSWFVPQFSPDGRRIAFDADFRRSPAVWLYDAPTRAMSKLNDGKRSTQQVLNWSSDGTRLLNARSRGLRTTFEWISVDAARAPDSVATFQAGSAIGAVGVSPDGRTFAVGTVFSSGGSNVIVRHAGGDSTNVPFAATDANEIAPRFSPDGRWIAYASDETGRYEVYVKPYQGPGARVQISDAGGGEPVWAKDGRRLFYRSGRAMIAAHIARGPSGVLTVSRREQLFTGDYYGGAANESGASYDVSPDGTRFVMARSLDGAGAQLFVWTGWLEEVKRRLNEGKN